MATYGMKDAANITLVDKKTKKVALFIDYANATSSEWSAERVYATKKGTQAIAWDSNRTGTLTLDSEIFDLSYLALAIGSDVAKGKNDIFRRTAITLDASMEAKLEGVIDPSSVSAIPLKSDMIEHAGSPVLSTTGNRALLPEMVRNVVVNANDTSAIVSFDPALGAHSYDIQRGGLSVGTVTSAQNTFTDEGLTFDTPYEYVVIAINEYGTAAPSAVVKATTTATGVTSRTKFEQLPLDIEAAELVEGELNSEVSSMVSIDFADGKVKFTNGLVGQNYAIYYMEAVNNVRTITVSADKFPSSYEVFADANIREQETGSDDFVQIHYKNARPQSNFTLTQSATEPTSLSVVFDLFPDNKGDLAEFKVVD